MMNREIKFRAWDKEIDRMFDLGSVPAIISGMRELAPEEHWITCTDHVLMQYTGLKDKNGVEIYEGDIVLVKGARICEIVFHEFAGCWDLKLIRVVSKIPIGNVLPSLYEYHTEIIANIYENPELLSK